jgi:hypothetical protein
MSPTTQLPPPFLFRLLVSIVPLSVTVPPVTSATPPRNLPIVSRSSTISSSGTSGIVLRHKLVAAHHGTGLVRLLLHVRAEAVVTALQYLNTAGSDEVWLQENWAYH